MAMREGIVRRMVGLPRSLIGGFSRRAMGHGRNLIGLGSSRRSHQTLHPSNIQLYPQDPLNDPQVSDFLHIFEQQYGTVHPFFYACSFMEALKIAEDEHKFLFMYLHSPDHPFTPGFCRETLSSELVVQFLDANFVSWAAIADGGEGVQMAATLGPITCFPFCAVTTPAPGHNIAVLRQIEGPISPAELVGILQRTTEEQGLAFRSSKAKPTEVTEEIIENRRLREEQDAAYLAALQIDKEKEKLKNLGPQATRAQKPIESPNHGKLQNHGSNKHHGSKLKEASTTKETQQLKEVASKGNKDHAQATRILIRFPNGERREESFLCRDKVQSIYRYVDSLGVGGIGGGNYRLISSFPKRFYGAEQMGMTLKDAGLHPRATLFLELL